MTLASKIIELNSSSQPEKLVKMILNGKSGTWVRINALLTNIEKCFIKKFPFFIIFTVETFDLIDLISLIELKCIFCVYEYCNFKSNFVYSAFRLNRTFFSAGNWPNFSWYYIYKKDVKIKLIWYEMCSISL